LAAVTSHGRKSAIFLPESAQLSALEGLGIWEELLAALRHDIVHPNFQGICLPKPVTYYRSILASVKPVKQAMKMSAVRKLFGPAAAYLDMIDAIAPIALNHEYTFVSDEWFANWIKTEGTVERTNSILALELIEKAHLAAITALMRTKRWVDAACLMYDSANFIGWAASVRGLLESAGDTVDGLQLIPLSLAQNHRTIRRCLAGAENNQMVVFSELEERLDHFVHARWMRTRRGEDNKLKAKENAAYVSVLDSEFPGTLKLFHQLCAICHPSMESLGYFYEPTLGHAGGLRLAPTIDAKAIEAISAAYPAALCGAVIMSCNAPLYILRVLHKFEAHPKLEALKNLDWKLKKILAEIERHLDK
jgi:hypothetical protein